MVRVVIDSNRLQSDESRAFLERCEENFAVLTDYAWMEAYKGNSILSIQKSMAVLKDFPDQVILLKGTKTVSALDPSAPGIAKRMQWPGKDGDFSNTVAGLKQAAAGNLGAIRQITEHGKAADRQMEKILADMIELPAALRDMMQTFLTKDEIAAIRARKPYSAALIGKLFELSDQMALRFYKAHPRKPRLPSRRARYDAFMYRFSLACFIYFLGWVREGGQINKAAEKFRNDSVDINFATYGTYFNGIMSDDKKVRELNIQLTIVLEKIGARVPKNYIDIFAEQAQIDNA